MRLPSLKAIQAFDAVARHHSFSKAAAELSVTHGAISRQVRLLEEDLDIRLFRRTVKGAELTEEGQVLFQSSKDAFAALHSGIADLRRRREDRTILVSLTTSLALKWIVPRLPDFHKRHPDISVLLDTTDSVVDFQKEPIDVALRFGGGSYPGLYAKELVKETLVPVASPALLTGLELPLSPKEMIKMPLVHNRHHPKWREWFLNAGLTSVPQKLAGNQYGDTGVVIAEAMEGHALALVRHLLAADDLATKRLVQVNDKSLPLDLSMYFLCRMGDQQRPVVALFLKWLKDILQDAGNRSGS